MGMIVVSISSWTHKSLELERVDPICQEGVGAGDLSVSAVRSGPVLDGFSRTRDRTSGPGPVLGQISDRTNLGLDRGPVPVPDQVGPS
jgi:hypothetical protein